MLLVKLLAHHHTDPMSVPLTCCQELLSQTAKFTCYFFPILYGLSFFLRVFQSVINDILHDMLGKYIITYMADIWIYLQNPEI